MTLRLSATLLLRAGARLGEGPRWDDRLQRLLWVDILAGMVHRLDPQSGRDERWSLGQEVGAALPTSDGDTLLLACRRGLHRFRPADGALELVTELEPAQPDNRCNDAAIDPHGRCWVGTMAMDVRPDAGALYRYQAGTTVRMLDGLGCSNGLAWNAVGTRLFFIDSLTRRIDVFAYDVASGTLGERRPLVAFPAADGLPDGLAIDSADRLWVGMWDGGCLRCCDPDTGEELARVAVPAARVTAACLGGGDGRSLFITTAQDGQGDGGDLYQARLPESWPGRAPATARFAWH